MVSQNYAVFAHLAVLENIGFGLRVAKLQGTEVDRRIRRTAELMHIEQLPKRYWGELSDGQSQRVAVTRALAMEPDMSFDGRAAVQSGRAAAAGNTR